jgi:hypothetical protein
MSSGKWAKLFPMGHDISKEALRRVAGGRVDVMEIYENNIVV